MIDINLIPRERSVAKQRRRRTVRWTLSLGIYAVLLIAGLSFLRLLWTVDGNERAAQIASLNTKINQAEAQGNLLRHEIRKANAASATRNTVSEQPDWSVLLTLIASKLGDDTGLRSIRLRPAAEVTQTSGSAAQQAQANAAPLSKVSKTKPGEFTLELTGVSESQTAVSKFVLGLEQFNVFQQVRLIETRREPFLSSEVIAFRVNCMLDSGLEDVP